MDKLWDDIHTGREIWGNHQFRVSPTSSLRRFLEGFAKAAAQMRALKTAAIWSPMTWHPYVDNDDDAAYWGKYHVSEDDPRAWSIIYEEPSLRKGSGITRKLEWLTWRWSPDSELGSLFRRIGLEKHGDRLEEFWADEIEDDYFPLRDEFEHRMYSYDLGYLPLSC
jgi:hypothetical protein